MRSQPATKLGAKTTRSAAASGDGYPAAQPTIDALRVGRQIFCPRHGIGVIAEHRQQQLLGQRRDYLTIDFPRKQLRIMLPADAAPRAGLRAVSTPAAAEQALAVLASNPAYTADTWTARIKHHQAKLATGCLTDIAEVVRDLAALDRNKRLAGHEGSVYQHARALLTSELMAALNLDEHAIETRIDTAAHDLPD
jgi:CarD family transcriptional regulator